MNWEYVKWNDGVEMWIAKAENGDVWSIDKVCFYGKEYKVTVNPVIPSEKFTFQFQEFDSLEEAKAWVEEHLNNYEAFAFN